MLRYCALKFALKTYFSNKADQMVLPGNIGLSATLLLCFVWFLSLMPSVDPNSWDLWWTYDGISGEKMYKNILLNIKGHEIILHWWLEHKEELMFEFWFLFDSNWIRNSAVSSNLWKKSNFLDTKLSYSVAKPFYRIRFSQRDVGYTFLSDFYSSIIKISRPVS